MMTETVRLIQSGNLRIPLFLSFVRASFPSPADDYKERSLDLDELVIQHPEATFYVKVSGKSMQDAGIDDGDVLVVDRAIDARHNAIIVAVLNGEFTVKRLYQENETVYLVPANPMYQPVRVTEDMNFQVWGVVTYCIRKVK
jgi:DNA polymerase V